MDSEAIIGDMAAVTRRWVKQRRAEERRAAAEERRWDRLTRTERFSQKRAAWEIIPEAYAKASSNGTLPAHARQIYYAARPWILERADSGTLDDQYFTQTLLPDFIAEHGCWNWNVVYDARGHFVEPHTDREISLGTIGVRDYLRAAREPGDDTATLDFGLELGLKRAFPTRGPDNRFGAILFVEKEGFFPLFREARLAERFDLAIMSSKGFSNTATRKLVDELCCGEVPLLVLHDLDKAGFSIAGTLRRDTRRYQWRGEPNVIDIGLRLVDVEAWVLQSEPQRFRGSVGNLIENGATDEEIEFLRDGRRVELNAFGSGELIEFIEGKLAEHEVKKVVPEQETLELALRRRYGLELMERRLARIVGAVGRKAAALEIPSGLEERVRDLLAHDPERPWDDVLLAILESEGAL